jgi:hypothetical protein
MPGIFFDRVFGEVMDDLEDNGWTLKTDGGRSISVTTATSPASPYLIKFKDENPYLHVIVSDRRSLTYVEMALEPTSEPSVASGVVSSLMVHLSSLLSSLDEIRRVHPKAYLDYMSDVTDPGDLIAHFVIGGLPATNIMVALDDHGVFSIYLGNSCEYTGPVDELADSVFLALADHERMELDEATWRDRAAMDLATSTLREFTRTVVEDLVDNGWVVTGPTLSGAICQTAARLGSGPGSMTVVFEMEAGDQKLYVCAHHGEDDNLRVGAFYDDDPDDLGAVVNSLIALSARVHAAIGTLLQTYDMVSVKIQPLEDFRVEDLVMAAVLLVRIRNGVLRRFELLVYQDGTYNAEEHDDTLSGTLETLPADLMRYFERRDLIREGYFTGLASRIQRAVLG